MSLKGPPRTISDRTNGLCHDFIPQLMKSPDIPGRFNFRIRDDKVYANGQVTLRRGGRMHHIGLGKEHAGQPVRMLIHDLHILVVHRDTGEILRELILDPDKNHQPRGLPQDPRKEHPAKAA